MSTLEDFDKQVKTLVQKGKLSPSHVTAITNLAIKNLSSDTHLVTTLFKAHRKASPNSKLTALYLIDAISREVRTRLKAIQRGKHKVASSSAEDGPSATTTTEEEGEAPSKESLQGFMMKMEQILSKIVVDGWENGVKEHREKIKKVLDIWSKAGTFEASALLKISNKIVTFATTEASQTAPPPPPTQSEQQSSAGAALPASVLALLSTNSPSSASPSPHNQIELNPSQLALLQSIASSSSTPRPLSPVAPSYQNWRDVSPPGGASPQRPNWYQQSPPPPSFQQLPPGFRHASPPPPSQHKKPPPGFRHVSPPPFQQPQQPFQQQQQQQQQPPSSFQQQPPPSFPQQQQFRNTSPPYPQQNFQNGYRDSVPGRERGGGEGGFQYGDRGRGGFASRGDSRGGFATRGDRGGGGYQNKSTRGGGEGGYQNSGRRGGDRDRGFQASRPGSGNEGENYFGNEQNGGGAPRPGAVDPYFSNGAGGGRPEWEARGGDGFRGGNSNGDRGGRGGGRGGNRGGWQGPPQQSYDSLQSQPYNNNSIDSSAPRKRRWDNPDAASPSPSIPPPAPQDSGLDEFGRAKRPEEEDAPDSPPRFQRPRRDSPSPAPNSPVPARAPPPPPPPAAAAVSFDPRPPRAPQPIPTMPQPIPTMALAPNAQPQPTSTIPPPDPTIPFDPSTFDATNPQSWVALSQWFVLTTGRVPTNAEMMQWVMGLVARSQMLRASEETQNGQEWQGGEM